MLPTNSLTASDRQFHRPSPQRTFAFSRVQQVGDSKTLSELHAKLTHARDYSLFYIVLRNSRPCKLTCVGDPWKNFPSAHDLGFPIRWDVANLDAANSRSGNCPKNNVTLQQGSRRLRAYTSGETSDVARCIERHAGSHKSAVWGRARRPRRASCLASYIISLMKRVVVLGKSYSKSSHSFLVASWPRPLVLALRFY